MSLRVGWPAVISGTWYTLLLLCQGTCLVREHSAGESFTSGILIDWHMCCGNAGCTGWRDLFSQEIQGGWVHFFSIDAAVLGSNNHALAVSGSEFSCALLHVTTLDRGFGAFFSFFPCQSICVGFCFCFFIFHKANGTWAMKQWGWSTFWRFGIYPGCLQEPGERFPAHRRDVLVGEVTFLVWKVIWKCCRSPF